MRQAPRPVFNRSSKKRIRGGPLLFISWVEPQESGAVGGLVFMYASLIAGAVAIYIGFQI